MTANTQHCTWKLTEQKTEASNICRMPDVSERAPPARSVAPLMNALTFLLINMLHQKLPGAVGGVTMQKRDVIIKKKKRKWKQE